MVNGKTVCIVLQNPSYAGEDVADKSVRFYGESGVSKGAARI